MTVFIAQFLASFLYVGLKSTQQYNVIYYRVFMVIPVSFAMAFCEVYVVHNVIVQGMGWIVIPIGMGSGLGCLSSMWLHRNLRTQNNHVQKL